MRKAYLLMALVTGLVVWALLTMLLNWWLATLVMLVVAWLFWKEVTPLLRYIRPYRRTGWQRNALRWTRREWPEVDSGDWPGHRRERRE